MNNDNTFGKIVPNDMYDSGDLKILLCYLLTALAQPIPGTETAQLFHYEGIANYFDVQTALSELESAGYTAPVADNPALLSVTAKGRALSDTLRDSVSPSLRNRVYNAVLKMLVRYKAERDTNITITQQPTGSLLDCTVNSSGAQLLSFSILLPNDAQAQALRQNILEDPQYYCDAFIQLLTEHNEEN